MWYNDDMIKFTIIWCIVNALFVVIGRLYINGLSLSERFRVQYVKKNKFENWYFGLVGLMTIFSIVFVFVSAIVLVCRYL